ncbi:hypothetical protein [Rivularia sp. UHCC 0363]|uniref:hypothetical protein n=1 Tax=Rivularia sp. UHCC 0363 TaxID=3110244 RepID=UPI002B2049BB|nr:hypothetical protein [Rivularia sp. UHCC 0363]MEA5594785.1 hypothetical protein [Rivularia sp. UHCC 0363]
MLRRRLSSFLDEASCFLGASCLIAVFSGCITAVVAVGGYSLQKCGIVRQGNTWNHVWRFALISSTVGVGSISSAFALASVSKKLHEELSEEEVSSNQLLSFTSLKLASEPEEKVKKPCVYTYYFVEIKGNPSINRLMVAPRMQSNSINLCNCVLTENEEDLALIHENQSEINPGLVGKTFSSYQPLTEEALREHLDIHRSYIHARQGGDFNPSNLQSCKGCQNLHGEDKIVCGIYPYGWDGVDCPDKNWDKRKALRPYEDDAVIASLAQKLDGWKIFKYDDFLSLFHPQTYGQFSFDFDGKLLPYSNRLAGLEEGNIVDYVYFLRQERQFQHDYSHADFIEKASLFLIGADATISVDDFKIFVKEKDSNVVHTFLHNGEPFFALNPACPPKLKDNYNLSTLIDFLYNGVDELDS